MVLSDGAVTCWSCRHATYHYIACSLWCLLYQREARMRCEKFEYEPGADEAERT